MDIKPISAQIRAKPREKTQLKVEPYRPSEAGSQPVQAPPWIYGSQLISGFSPLSACPLVPGAHLRNRWSSPSILFEAHDWRPPMFHAQMELKRWALRWNSRSAPSMDLSPPSSLAIAARPCLNVTGTIETCRTPPSSIKSMKSHFGARPAWLLRSLDPMSNTSKSILGARLRIFSASWWRSGIVEIWSPHRSSQW